MIFDGLDFGLSGRIDKFGMMIVLCFGCILVESVYMICGRLNGLIFLLMIMIIL